MLISKFGPVSEDEVLEYEDKIGSVLPEEYRLFLCKYNGGETPNTSFKCGKTSSDIKGFYGIGDIKYSLNGINMVETKGVSCLPIAFDSFGNEILIRMNDGAIAFYDHEDGSIRTLERGFRDFLTKCESLPISKSSVKSVEEREKDLIARGRGNIINEALREMWRVEINKYGSLQTEEVQIV